jgi:hypothetical protein
MVKLARYRNLAALPELYLGHNHPNVPAVSKP